MTKQKTQSSHNTAEQKSSKVEKLQRPQSFQRLPPSRNPRQQGRQESKPPKSGSNNNPPKTPKKTSKG